jgi:hypothetical protein
VGCVYATQAGVRLAITHAELAAVCFERPSVSIGGHEDAERMTCQIGVHEEWLVWIIGSIEKQARSQPKRPLMLSL